MPDPGIFAVCAGYGAIADGNTVLLATTGRMPDVRTLGLTRATRRPVARTAVFVVGALPSGVGSVSTLLRFVSGKQAGLHAVGQH